MALDAFSVIVAFLAVVEAVLGGAACVLGIREMRGGAEPVREARRPLLVLVVVALIAAALASVPLFYLLLASWVPRWPGVMCAEGVRRIGMGSLGAPGWLPSLVSALDVVKPVLVFVAGAWVVLRRAQGVGAARAAAIAVTLLGFVAVIDGTLATAYVTIPKDEIPPLTGCCMTSALAASRDAGLTPAGGVAAPTIPPAAFVAIAAVLGIAAILLRFKRPASAVMPAVFALAAAASLLVAIPFLRDVAAPAVLDLPYHHCVWCAFASAPETIVGAALYLVAVLAAGWSVFARLFRFDGADPAGTLFGVAAFGFLAAAAMAVSILGQTS